MKTTAYCRVTAIQKSKGHSAAAKIQYIERTGRYKNKPGLIAIGNGNLPNGFDNFHQFWKLADQNERANSVTAREFLIDLPDHLSMKDALNLAKMYSRQITKCPETDRPLPYSWAVHANEEGHGRHMHLVMSERVIDNIEREPATFFKQQIKKTPERGGAPKLANNASVLKRRTERVKRYIEKASNLFLEAAGLDMTVDFKRTVKDGKRPQIKLTAKEWGVMKSGKYEPGTNKRIDEFIEIDEYNNGINDLIAQRAALDAEIAELERLPAPKPQPAPEVPVQPQPTSPETESELDFSLSNEDLLAQIEAEYAREDAKAAEHVANAQQLKSNDEPGF